MLIGTIRLKETQKGNVANDDTKKQGTKNSRPGGSQG
jgi:hypothetical protein